MNLHPGINMSRVSGNGLEDLPGLLITIAFIAVFAGMFVPRESGNWFLLIFLSVEAIAAGLYLWKNRHDREESQRLKDQMHRINEQSKR